MLQSIREFLNNRFRRKTEKLQDSQRFVNRLERLQEIQRSSAAPMPANGRLWDEYRQNRNKQHAAGLCRGKHSRRGRRGWW